MLETLSSIFGIAFVSGINLYAAILTVGFGQRLGWISGLPESMQVLSHPAVLIVAGLFYVLEFFADKIPFLTPIWDGVHTFIRPLGAALLALQSAADLSPMAKVAAVLIGGSVALGTHSTKAGFRLLAHAAPEPATHSVISIAEDFGVVALLLLAYKYPLIALPVLILLTAAIIVIAPLLFRILRFTVAGLMGRVHSWFSDASGETLPGWADSKDAIRCYKRSGNLLHRMREGYLATESGGYRFVSRRWFRPQAVVLAGSASIRRGMLFDVLTIGDHSFYVTKEWSKQCAERTSATCSAAQA